MGFWIAILITLAMAGSVLWVMPSPREKSLTAMRNRALELGMQVRLLDQKLAKSLFYWLEDYRLFVLYECMLPTEARPKSAKARIVRLSIDAQAHELDANDPLKDSLVQAGVFSGLPETCEALVISRAGLAILWRERQADKASLQEIDAIRSSLDACAKQYLLWLED